jgi:L-asparaginase/Glu-tRNA(Gln) amidotransferase subunit D
VTSVASRVVVVLTGGTIGQRPGTQGSVPDADATVGLVVRSAPDGVDVRCLRAMDRNSPDVSPRDWSTLARIVVTALRDGADGVVILHGTDTMAYTASALAFALQGLDRPVVLTGSMMPGSASDSDAQDNLASAFVVATSPVAGVSVVLGSPDEGVAADVLPPTRLLKVRTSGRAAFRAVGARPLARVVEGRVVDDGDLRPSGDALLATTTVFAETVDLIKITPMTTARRLRRLLAGLDGVVLEGFGAGHVPSDHLGVLRAFDGPVVVSTQVTTDAERLGGYASDQLLLDIPQVVRAGRMTSVTALVKLSWALGQGLDVRETMEMDVVGEHGTDCDRRPT